MAAPRSDRWLTALLAALIGAVAVQMQLWLWDWYIEDAAISFTYARHLASGEGLVAFPGGERVEGYSNPTWVLFMAALELVGVTPWASSKYGAAVLAVLTVWVTWAIARRLVDDPNDRVIGPLAALLLAANPQYAIWNASGLENAIFSFFLALGMWRALVEAEGARPRFPASAVAFALLALSRPEGAMYALVGAASSVMYQLARWRASESTGRQVATYLGGWAVLAAGLFGAHQAFRLWYFAWPLPNTYYAKLGDKAPKIFDWGSRGWTYVRAWAEASGVGWQLPLVWLGVQGGTWRRTLITVALGLVFTTFLLLPPPQVLANVAWFPRPELPAAWDDVKVPVLAGGFALLGATALGRPGWRVRVPSAVIVAAGVLFAVRADGDWMKGWRWCSLFAVPLSLLLAGGIRDVAGFLACWLRRWPRGASILRGALVVGGISATVFPSAELMASYRKKPETTPFQVRKRVDYNNHLQRLLHLDRAQNFEVDMGATMWWSGDDLLDVAGLTDMPIAHHTEQRAFITEYIFEEERPEFMHTHKSWARRLGVERIPLWKQDYFETPGYTSKGYGKGHGGCMVRKDLFVLDAWEGPPEREVTFEDDVELLGWNVPVRLASPDRRMYFEIAFRSRDREPDERFELLAFLANDENQRVWSVPVGFGFYPPEEWGDGEIVRTKLAPPLDGLPVGEYDFGVVVVGPDGPLSPVQTGGAVVPGADVAARVSTAEVRWPDVVRVVTPDVTADKIEEHLADLRDAAAAGRCDDAERAWRHARAYRSMDDSWLAVHVPEWERLMGVCWVVRSEQAPDRAARIRALSIARDWDHWNRDQWRLAAPLADERMAEGEAALVSGDAEVAYAAFRDVLALDATRSWARRYAEDARNLRLGIRPFED